MENKITLVKIFITEKEADSYAKINNGKVEIRYDFDDFRNEIIKTFIVKFSVWEEEFDVRFNKRKHTEKIYYS